MSFPLRLILVVSYALFAAPAAAATLTWTGSAGDSDFTNPSNWNPAATPGPADDLVVEGGRAASASGHLVDGGSLTVRGSAGEVDLGQDLGFGDGSLVVEQGGTLLSFTSSLGVGAGHHASAILRGAGSSWDVGQAFSVGEFGSGELRIEGGASLRSGGGSPSVANYSHIAREAGSAGRVVVTGAGSVWRNDQSLWIGDQGHGELEILDGGRVSLENNGFGVVVGLSRFGNTGAGSGSILVSGPGSTLAGVVTVGVGHSGTPGVDSTLRIENGGQLARDGAGVGGLLVAQGRTAVGTVVLTGAGTRAEGDGFTIGRDGRGRLEILDGAVAEVTGDAILGIFAFGAGEALVSGAGSRWNIDGRLTMGQSAADSSLRIADGGLVRVGGLLTGANGAEIELDGATLDVAQATITQSMRLFGEGLVAGGNLHVDGTVEGTGTEGLRIEGALTGGGDLRGRVVLEKGLAGGDGASHWLFDDVELAEDADLHLSIGGRTPGSEHDQIAIAGLVKLAGRLVVDVDASFASELVVGDTFEVFDLEPTGALTGSFSGLVFPSRGWDTSQLLENGTLVFTPEPGPVWLAAGTAAASLALRRRKGGPRVRGSEV